MSTSGYNSPQPGGTYTPYTGNGASRFGGTPDVMASREAPKNGPSYVHRPLQSELAQQSQQQSYIPPQSNYNYPPQQQPYGGATNQYMVQLPTGQQIDPQLDLERYLDSFVSHVSNALNVVPGLGDHLRQRLWQEAMGAIPVVVGNYQSIVNRLGTRYSTELVCDVIVQASAHTLISHEPNAQNLAGQLDQYGNGLYGKLLNALRMLAEWVNTPAQPSHQYGQPQSNGYGQPQQPQQGGFGQGNNQSNWVTTTTGTEQGKPQVSTTATAKVGGLWQLHQEAEVEAQHQYRDQPQFIDNELQPLHYTPSADIVPQQRPEPQPGARTNNAWAGGTQTPPRAIDQPLEFGNDPAFNQALDQMYQAASAGEAQFEHKKWQTENAAPSLYPEVEVLDETQIPDADMVFRMCNGDLDSGVVKMTNTENSDGVMEDLDDYSFDPKDPNHTDRDLEEFAIRLFHNGNKPINGYRMYDATEIPQPRFPITSPFPTAYDVLSQKRFMFVNDENIIVELIKVRTMEMQDHVDDDLSVSTEGKRVNILAVLEGIEPRMNIAKNRKEYKEDLEKGITAKVATADQEAFNNVPINTTSEEMSTAFIAQLEDRRDVSIEGYHDRRLTPIYLGAKGVKELEKFNHILGACTSFKSFTSKIPEALDRLPADFEREFRKRLTAYFNDMVQTRIGADYECDDFMVDFDEMVELLNEELGERTVADKLQSEYKRFARFAKVLPRSSRGYTDVLGTLFDNDDFVVFVTSISTIVVPFTSEDAGSHLPNGKTKAVGVNESDTPQLYGLLRGLVQSGREVFNGMANILRLVTRDDKVYYVDISAFAVSDDVLVVSTTNNLAKHLVS